MLKAFSWVVGGNLSRQIAFLVVNAVLYDRLPRSTFGALALAFGYMVIFAGLGEFGIRQIGWREIARRPREAQAVTGPFLVTKSATSLAALAVYLLAMPLLWEADLPASIYLIYGLAILLNGGTFDFPLFGLDRVDLFARYSAIAFALYTVICLALVHEDGDAWIVPTAFVIAMTLLTGLAFRWFFSEVGTFRLRTSRSQLRRVLEESWSLGVAETLNRVALNYPLILIGLIVGSDGVGDYRIAEMGYSFLAQFGHMFAAAGFSRVAYLFVNDRLAARMALGKMLRLVAVLSAAAGAAVTLAGPTAFALVFGETPPPTAAVLRLLGIALAFAGPTRFLKHLLASLGEQRALLAVNAWTIAIGAAVALATLPDRGIAGMALGISCAEGVALILLGWRIRRALVPPSPR